MMTTASPAAKSNPAVIAACWPKLRLKFKTLIVRIGSRKTCEDSLALVGTAIIDENNFAIAANSGEFGLQSLKSQLQIGGLIVDRDHNRKQHRLTMGFQCLIKRLMSITLLPTLASPF